MFNNLYNLHLNIQLHISQLINLIRLFLINLILKILILI